jgi:hypothetical protein
METGLFEIQAEHLRGLRQPRQVHQAHRDVVYALFGRADAGSFDRDPAAPHITNGTQSVAGSAPKSEPAVDPTAQLARCFLRLANLHNYPLDRLSRYEATLWRQAGQTLLALEASDRRKPWDRRRRFHLGGRQGLQVYEPEE